MTSIAVENLTKRFKDVTAVDGLSFEVSSGRVTGFVGPNGAGKTTTMRCLLDLASPTSGTAIVNGKRYRDLDNPLRTVGTVLEGSSFYPGRTGRDHLRVLGRTAGVGDARVDEVLDMVGLAAFANKRTKGYSLGMRQRLAIGGALLADPEVLVLDEPANGLDPAGIRWMRELLRYHASKGGLVLISSHVLSEVAVVVDDVVVVDHGKLVRIARLDELTRGAEVRSRFKSPAADKLADLLREQGIKVEASEGALLANAAPDVIGDLAAAKGIALHELVQDMHTLEEAFFELTGETEKGAES
ncbi:MAG TPA: ATP-binding cassette domain-containing protein [Actinomycetota bacterium]|nr:ATP-binding cassette domain-containing protein [Actinomycetota bacterium]